MCDIFDGLDDDVEEIDKSSYWKAQSRISKLEIIFEYNFYYKCDDGLYWINWEDIPKYSFWNAIPKHRIT